MAVKPADLLPTGPRTVVGWWVRKGDAELDPLGLATYNAWYDDKNMTAAYAVEATEADVIESGRANPDEDGWMDFEFALAACLPGLHECIEGFDQTYIEEDPGSPENLDVDGWTVVGGYYTPGDWKRSGRTCAYTWSKAEASTPWEAYLLTVAHAESHRMLFLNAAVFPGILKQDPDYPFFSTDVKNAEEMEAKFRDDWPMQRQPDWNETTNTAEDEPDEDSTTVVTTYETRTYASPMVRDVVVVEPTYNPYGYWYNDPFVPVMDPVTALEIGVAAGITEAIVDDAFYGGGWDGY